MRRLYRKLAALLLGCLLLAPMASCADLADALNEYASYADAGDAQSSAAPVQQAQYDGYYGTIPAWLNGTSVNLLLKIDGENPDGAVVGAYQTLEDTNGMAPKNLIEIKDGDEIAFAFCGEEFVDVDAPQDEDSVTKWYQGETIRVDGSLTFTFGDVDPGEYMYGFTLVDYYGNESYTDFIVVTYE